MVNKIICQPREWENIFTNPTSDRGLISKIYKGLKRLDIKRTNNPIKKMGSDLNRDLTRDEAEMAERHLRKLNAQHP